MARDEPVRLRVAAYTVCVALVALIVGVALRHRTAAPQYEGFKKFQKAAVVGDSTTCSKIGANILRAGGNAVDACVASMICAGVINAQNAGIGGGHISLLYAKRRGGTKRELMAIFGREVAPLAATEDMFVNKPHAAVTGALAIATPSEVMGYYETWRDFGSGMITWSELVTPTVRLCQNGYRVPFILGRALQLYEQAIKSDNNLRALYTHPDGSILQEGDVIQDLTLAGTLERIAEDPMSFYNGSLARDIVADLQEAGSIITPEDLSSYRARINEAVTVNLNNGDLTLAVPGPPSGGPILAFIMKIMDGYNLTSADLATKSDRILTYHRMLEAYKFAFAKRTELGDDLYVNIKNLMSQLTDPAFAEETRQKISDDHTEEFAHYGANFDLHEDHGTSHSSVLDEEGNAMTTTSTVNLFFGSKLRGSRTGIIFNNDMDDFSTPGASNFFGVPPSPSNFISPGKMPVSSMAPAIFLNKAGEVVFVTGSAGGSRIPTQLAQVSMHCLWLGERVDVATSRLRIHHQLLPNTITYEEGYDQEILAGLGVKGHEQALHEDPHFLAVVESIHNTCLQCSDNCEDRCIQACTDIRAQAAPDGL